MGQNQRAQIVMSHDEVVDLINSSRVVTMATNGPAGHPHLVAMWYGVVDDAICFETKVKSQKVRNLQRDPRISCLLEAGDTYDQLRGAALEGTAQIIDDADYLWRVGVSVWERYHGPFTEDVRPMVEAMLHKRVAVRVDVERVRSWDHRKLGLPPMGEPGGTTVAAARRPS